MIPALFAVVALLVVLRLDVLLDHFLRNKK
jgi:hypothetical protein